MHSCERHSSVFSNTGPLLPLAAMLMAGSLTVQAETQETPLNKELTLKTVVVKDLLESPISAKDNLLVKQSGIAKGQQSLKDIPQTVTVLTEKLMDDRNLDDFREVMKITAGVTFQAGETGEEDVRMRGFSLAQAGDIYVDGLKDAPLVERNMFNVDRVEVLKGSASMLFGKGSTGGVVNQVSKQAFLMDQSEVNVTLGSGQLQRIAADFNLQTGDSSALRMTGVLQTADNWGAEQRQGGLALNYRWQIGERDEYSISVYQFESDGRPLYSHPWLLSAASGPATVLPQLKANAFYGLASDYLHTETQRVTLSHKYRLDADSELTTHIRHGQYERNLLGTQVGWASGTTLGNLTDSTVIRRIASKSRHGNSTVTQVQSDYATKFKALGRQHELLAGLDYFSESANRNNSATAGLTSLASMSTTVGAPNDGASIATNRAIPMNHFKSHTLGMYAQDSMAVSADWKLIGGLRWDRFEAAYVDAQQREFLMAESLWSPRLGAVWQPNDRSSYYLSYGTSYNTSADTYQYAVNLGLTGAQATLANTPPEKSRNLEVGAKWDIWNRKALLGVSVFRSEKFNERNTDVDSVGNQFLLSGKRHAAGMEFNLAGRLTAAWDVFYNHTWIPNARIDTSSQKLSATGAGAQVQGDRPGLTPHHSASLWSTYQINSQWRVGGGLNHRGAQNPDGQRTLTAQAFTTADVMLEHTLNDTALVKLNVSNLSNKLYIDQLYRGFYIPGASRRMELSLKKFI